MKCTAKGKSSVLFFILLFAVNCEACQLRTQLTSPVPPHTVVIVRVVNEEGLSIDQDEQVRLFSGEGGLPIAVNTDAGCATFDEIPAGNYEATVEVPGYQPGEVEFVVPEREKEGIFRVDLRLARELATTPPMPNATSVARKARKEMKKGFEALKAGNLKESTQELDAAYVLRPKDPDVNFLMGLLSVALKDSEQAKTDFFRASSLDPQHVPSLVALGQLLFMQGDVTRAAALLQRAVSLDRKLWLAHWLLARIYLQSHNYDSTKQEAEQAAYWGKRDAITAEFLIGLALINLGRVDEAISALEQYSREAPVSPATSRAHELIVQLQQNPNSIADSVARAELAESDLSRLLDIPTVEPALPSWIPTSLDDERPTVTQGRSCPLAKVLDGTGKSVEQFFANIGSFTATEFLVHQRLDSGGQPTSEETRTFDYLAFTRTGGLSFDEYRNGSLDPAQFPGQIATLGLSGLELVFHPKMRDDYLMTCEGLGEWRGQTAWLVDFQQRDDRPRHLQSFQVDGMGHPVDVKGRAWISSENFQVLRLETDIVRPIPKIHLLEEREFVEYRPIQFHIPSVQLWLPASAEIYLNLGGKRYRRVHSFSDYKIFSVETKQIIEPPKELSDH
jgi:tetratricopeptide (TPR) repeat protein